MGIIHAVIFAGMTHVVPSTMSKNGLPRSERTVAEMLKQEGYATALIGKQSLCEVYLSFDAHSHAFTRLGKWHLGWNRDLMDHYYHPNNYGFQYFFGLPIGATKDFGGKQDMVKEFGVYPTIAKALGVCLVSALLVGRLLSTRTGVAMAMVATLLFAYFMTTFKTFGIWNSLLVRNEEYIELPVDFSTLTQRLLDESRRFIAEQHAAHTPFFLYLSFIHVHSTLHPQPPFKG
jgi:hypothetical protein